MPGQVLAASTPARGPAAACDHDVTSTRGRLTARAGLAGFKFKFKSLKHDGPSLRLAYIRVCDDSDNFHSCLRPGPGQSPSCDGLLH